MHCASNLSSHGKQAQGAETASACVKLASQAIGASAKGASPVLYVCVDEQVWTRRKAAQELADMGFPLPWCAQALKVVDGDSGAAVSWLLANPPPA